MPLPVLTPDELIQQGQVYTLPQSQYVQVQIPNQTQVFQIDQGDYERRFNKLVKSTYIPPDQEKSAFINFLIYNQLYQEDNSFSNKLKKAFNKRK